MLQLQVVREGQTQFFGPARLPMRMGTVVTLRDAFFKWPVRRKAANEVPTTIDDRWMAIKSQSRALIEQHLIPLLLCAGVNADVTCVGIRLLSPSSLEQVVEITRIKEHVSRMALINNVAITVLDSGEFDLEKIACPLSLGNTRKRFTIGSYVTRSCGYRLAREGLLPVECVNPVQRTLFIFFTFWRIFCLKNAAYSLLDPCSFSARMGRVRSAKSKIVLKAAATGSVTKTFAQVFASDKLSLCRKVKS